ncbi:MAG: aspartate aminotransferase [Candidatus Krumholzibacteriia bacterium]|jgi:aspartate aminotransferase
MPAPQLSDHFSRREPSAIRLAQIEFSKRKDGVRALNVAIGNVSLPMHPAMQERMNSLGGPGSPFETGVVKYTATVGTEEANAAFVNLIASSGGETSRLLSQVTDGGSQGMELVITGCCGAPGTDERPLMLIDAAYTNYMAFAERLGRETVSITRTLDDEGQFSLPGAPEITAAIVEHNPGAMVIIPYDNPTGQLYDRESLIELAKLCVEHNLWIISDEAYRELYYTDASPVSIWSLSESEVPGIGGRRISIETASKVWNACGLRIGALVTDNPDFHERAVAENTASLCSNAIGQYIFGALAHQSHAELKSWYNQQRHYYQEMLGEFTEEMRNLLPGVIVSNPDASIYSVVDLRKLVGAGFEAMDFVLYCARQGRVEMGGEELTLLTAPMSGFYNITDGADNPGRTQLRIAYVESPAKMRCVPKLLAELFHQFQNLA